MQVSKTQSLPAQSQSTTQPSSKAAARAKSVGDISNYDKILNDCGLTNVSDTAPKSHNDMLTYIKTMGTDAHSDATLKDPEEAKIQINKIEETLNAVSSVDMVRLDNHAFNAESSTPATELSDFKKFNQILEAVQSKKQELGSSTSRRTSRSPSSADSLRRHSLDIAGDVQAPEITLTKDPSGSVGHSSQVSGSIDTKGTYEYSSTKAALMHTGTTGVSRSPSPATLEPDKPADGNDGNHVYDVIAEPIGPAESIYALVADIPAETNSKPVKAGLWKWVGNKITNLWSLALGKKSAAVDDSAVYEVPAVVQIGLEYDKTYEQQDATYAVPAEVQDPAAAAAAAGSSIRITAVEEVVDVSDMLAHGEHHYELASKGSLYTLGAADTDDDGGNDIYGVATATEQRAQVEVDTSGYLEPTFSDAKQGDSGTLSRKGSQTDPTIPDHVDTSRASNVSVRSDTSELAMSLAGSGESAPGGSHVDIDNSLDEEAIIAMLEDVEQELKTSSSTVAALAHPVVPNVKKAHRGVITNVFAPEHEPTQATSPTWYAVGPGSSGMNTLTGRHTQHTP